MLRLHAWPLKGPIADQAKAVKASVEAKNKFHHDAIFCGSVLTTVPEWIAKGTPPGELGAKKKAAITELLAKLSALDAEVAKPLVMKANMFAIVPGK